jgi:Apea-like HEPN
MIDEEGRLTFTSQKFYSKWQELADFLGADRIAYKTIAPLPYLVVPIFPLRLNEELVLDRLSEDEVNRCYHVGVLRHHFSGFPFVDGEWAVGIRRTTFTPKLIRQEDEPLSPPEAGDEGSFGERPPYRGDLIIEDVISALRLFKRTQIRAAGLAIWTDAPGLAGATQSQVLGRWPYGGRFELSESEVPQILKLWHLLEEGGAARFKFPIRRFNLSFERGLLDERIVDLIIAAESLLLSDLGPRDRGELKFRLTLRAAKFFEHPSYSEHEVYQVMRRAYDARSAVVHGGRSPEDIRLPDNPSADLRTFIEAIEDLVRLGLRKALSMKQDGKKLREAEYWNTLALSTRSGAVRSS